MEEEHCQVLWDVCSRPENRNNIQNPRLGSEPGVSMESQEACVTGVSKKGVGGDELGEKPECLGHCSEKFAFHDDVLQNPGCLNKGQ